MKFITSSIGRRNPSIITEAQFQEGVLGMKEGEKRVLILDPPIISGQGGTYTYSDEEIWIEVEVEEIVF